MVRHVVMFRWKPGTFEVDKQAVRDGLTELPGAIADIQRYAFGDDAGLAEGNFDFAVVADFQSADAYGRYAVHPAHQDLIAKRIRPHLAERVAVQYELDP